MGRLRLGCIEKGRTEIAQRRGDIEPDSENIAELTTQARAFADFWIDLNV